MEPTDYTTEQDQVIVAGHPVALARRRGDGPCLLLLHGAGGSHRGLSALIGELAPLPVIAPSLPGRDESGGAPPSSVEAAADWVERLLDALGVRRPAVLGHSYGGAIALELALRGVAERLILVSTGARLRVQPAVLAYLEAQAARGGLVELPPGAGPQPAAAALADWRSADAFDRLGDLGAVATPTLVIAGEQDRLTPPRYARYLAEHIGAARLELLAGQGHLLPTEAPRLLAMSTRGFLAAPPPRPAIGATLR